MRSLPFGAKLASFALAAAALAAGCSLVNAPDDIVEGSGGSPTTTTTTGMGGMAPACTLPEDCASLTTECAVGNCVQGSCVAEPKAAGEPCGQTAQGSCDLDDTCDGSGSCVDNTVADGTFCSDCAAGPGNCGFCDGGVCPDCPQRAATKTFRSPLAAQGWEFTGDWRVYEEAPPAVVFGGNKPERQCKDTFDNDGDGFIDFPNDPQCTSLEDPFETPPQCNDGFDNDGDGLSDMADPDCASPTQEFETAPIRFQRPVLGTNGNRKNAYYIGSEREISQATSPPTVIPANLEFLSWHLDEGAAFDLKAVQVSTDGVSYTTIAICTMGGGSPFPFCDFITQRDANDWDAISLPVPPQFVGQVGRVRFLYDTSDGCCQFERGWFVDALNFATDCACSASTECAYLTTGCASGVCDTQECVSQPANVGASCTLLGGSADCGGGACSDNGFCAPITTNDTSDCGDCTEGPGLCTYCSLGACPNCPAVQRFFNFSFGPQWTLSGDWGFFDSCLPPNQVTPNEFLCVNFPQDPTTPLAPGWLYNNGSRTFANPWTFAAREIEVGSARLGPAVIPAMLTFNSWHQDRGGNNTFMPRDTKVIRGSLDGVNWTTIVNCDGNMTIPFCLPWPTPGMNRPITSFDAVSIPVPQNLAGQTGFIEITYDTVDQGQGWERGWIIDDINFARCD